jgi:hypothetical protein
VVVSERLVVYVAGHEEDAGLPSGPSQGSAPPSPRDAGPADAPCADAAPWTDPDPIVWPDDSLDASMRNTIAPFQSVPRDDFYPKMMDASLP